MRSFFGGHETRLPAGRQGHESRYFLSEEIF